MYNCTSDRVFTFGFKTQFGVESLPGLPSFTTPWTSLRSSSPSTDWSDRVLLKPRPRLARLARSKRCGCTSLAGLYTFSVGFTYFC